MNRSSFRVLCSVVVCSALLPMRAVAQADAVSTIPEAELTALEEQLAQGVRGATSVAVRRACKSVVREAQALLERVPQAENRFRVLGIVFEGQKRVLTLEPSEENRNAMFETCDKLREAPDVYAEFRLEADMLLMEKALSERNAVVADRVRVLEEMLARYRGTAAEWKSLMMGSLIAGRLQAFDCDDAIGDRMQERFSGDHTAIEYLRNSRRSDGIDAIFSGQYQTPAGSALVFPADRLGHDTLMCFWSAETPQISDYLRAIKAQQEKCTGRLAVFSLNVDELPDAGEGKLRKLGLDWMALRLPGGRKSPAYRAYAQRDPTVLFVNPQGHVQLSSSAQAAGESAVGRAPDGASGAVSLPDLSKLVDDPRYLAQLQYLFIGDFLVADSARSDSIPAETLQEIQSCFTLPPLRYRISGEAALANYRKAETLCATAIGRYATSPDLWMVRNRRIIALLGMWNLACEPKYLAEAAQEAGGVLGMRVSPGAEVAARFCLAYAAVRNDRADPELVLRERLEESGGERVPARALAAAAVLALATNARTIHEPLARRVGDCEGDGDPVLWPVCALLRDRHHRFRNFRAAPGGPGLGRAQKYAFRDMVSGLGEPRDTHRLFKVELTRLAGGKITIPKDTGGAMLGVILVEPPADASARKELMARASQYAKAYATRQVKVITAFLSDDVSTVTSMVDGYGADGETAILPGGLQNPVVNQLGVVAADRMPNPLLLREDGSIAWFVSDLDYAAGNNVDHAVDMAIGANIEKVRSDVAFESLEQANFKKAIELFDRDLAGDKQRHDWWVADRLQGRALAHVGMGDWPAALNDIDAAIERRRADFKSGMCKCHGVVEMLLTKAGILDKLGRGQEATIERRRAEAETLPHSKLPPGDARQGVPVGVYYNWLRQVRQELEAKDN